MRTALVLVLTAAAASPLLAQANDTVVRNNGKRDRGVEILETSITGIQFRRPGDEPTTVAASEVREIEWSEPPESFDLAAAAEKRGDFSTAANLYLEAANAVRRDVFKAEIEFLAARALVRAASGDPAKAAEAASRLESWKAAHAEGWRLPDVLLETARAHRLAGNAEAAQQAVRELEDAVVAQSLAPIWTARARLEKARVFLGQNNVQEARTAFRSAGNAARSIDDSLFAEEAATIATEATVGEGETFIQAGEFDAALSYFAGLANDRSRPAAARAAALAGEGQALFLKAEAAGNTDGLRRAQIALANASVLDTLSGATTAKAIFYSAKILLTLGKEGREVDDFRERAMARFQTITESYSETEWATRAAAELNR